MQIRGGRFLDQPCYLQTLNSASDRCSDFEAALFQALFTAGVYRYLHCPALASAGQRWAAIVAKIVCFSKLTFMRLVNAGGISLR